MLKQTILLPIVLQHPNLQCLKSRLASSASMHWTTKPGFLGPTLHHNPKPLAPKPQDPNELTPSAMAGRMETLHDTKQCCRDLQRLGMSFQSSSRIRKSRARLSKRNYCTPQLGHPTTNSRAVSMFRCWHEPHYQPYFGMMMKIAIPSPKTLNRL